MFLTIDILLKISPDMKFVNQLNQLRDSALANCVNDTYICFKKQCKIKISKNLYIALISPTIHYTYNNGSFPIIINGMDIYESF